MPRGLICAAITVVMTAAAVASCGSGSGSRGEDGGECSEPDKAVVEQVMAGARENFRPVSPDGEEGAFISRIELIGAQEATLPADDRRFGAERLMAVNVSTVMGGEDASGDFNTIEGPVVFALDSEGRLLGPVGTYTASMFDLEAPQDPGWWDWGEKVEVSPFAGELYDCVDPSA